jgi:hypothetical protein
MLSMLLQSGMLQRPALRWVNDIDVIDIIIIYSMHNDKQFVKTFINIYIYVLKT